MKSENHQQVSDLQIKLGDQEDSLLAQRKEIKQLVEQLNEKEVHIKELAFTIEAKDKLLSETMKSTTTQDIQTLHSHNGTESSIEVDAETTTKMDAKVAVSSRVLI